MRTTGAAGREPFTAIVSSRSSVPLRKMRCVCSSERVPVCSIVYSTLNTRGSLSALSAAAYRATTASGAGAGDAVATATAAAASSAITKAAA